MYDQHIILDLEMNPVDKSRRGCVGLAREVIEIGAVKLNSNYEVIDCFSCFVKPEYNSDISTYITKLTGISLTDVQNSLRFNEAMNQFTNWIGKEKTRIYSWSDSDLIQLKKECYMKSVQMPANMSRWIDVQLVYPRLMKIGIRRQKMSLQEAAAWYGISVEHKKAHRALYDAEITTELVVPVLSGEYKKQLNTIKQNMTECEKGICLGDLCGGFFAQLLQNINLEPDYAR